MISECMSIVAKENILLNSRASTLSSLCLSLSLSIFICYISVSRRYYSNAASEVSMFHSNNIIFCLLTIKPTVRNDLQTLKSGDGGTSPELRQTRMDVREFSFAVRFLIWQHNRTSTTTTIADTRQKCASVWRKIYRTDYSSVSPSPRMTRIPPLTTHTPSSRILSCPATIMNVLKPRGFIKI